MQLGSISRLPILLHMLHNMIIGLPKGLPRDSTLALCNSRHLGGSTAVTAHHPSCYTMLRNIGGVQMLGFKLFSKELTQYLNTAGTLSKVFKDEYKSDFHI